MWLHVPENWSDDYDDRINILDGCAGSGMLGRAVELALEGRGLPSQTLVHLERDAAAASACVGIDASAQRKAAVWDDLATFDGLPWRGCIDIACAGLPCPAFSAAGKRAGNDDPRAWGLGFDPGRRDTWGPQPHWLRILDEVRPDVALFENVPAWVTAGHFATVGAALSRLGYCVEEPVFITADAVGGSHRRERVFVLAHRDIEGLQGRGSEESAWGRREQPAERGGSVREGGMSMADCARERIRPARAGVARERSRPVRLHCPGRPDLNDPNDPAWSAWAAVADVDPSRMPAIESGVSVVADGMAFSNADLLRISGNGVDALAAAVAVYVLLARAGIGG